MAKVSHPDLQPNPYKTYRDPQTGLWIVIKPASATLKTPPSLADNQYRESLEKS